MRGWWLIVMGAALGATSCHSNVLECVRGRQVACTCADGSDGVQTCNRHQYFDDCHCGVTIDVVTTGAGASSGSGGASGGSGGASSSSGGTGGGVMGTSLSSGSSALIDVFVGNVGVYVVLLDEVRLVDRHGALITSWPSPRDITAAAFDGVHLGVADTAVLNLFDENLNPTMTANLVQSCSSAVMVSGPRFICGPANDWDRIFHTFDAVTGSYLAGSQPYTYKGIPMRRVPGSDEFVTVTVGTSPPDVHLFETLATGEASYINESPYHGDFPLNNVYTFDGASATHLVTHTGLMLLIHGPGCVSGASPFNSECFLQDGLLGTLSGNQRFVGMDQDGAGHVLGLVDVNNSPVDPSCEAGCLVQKVDIASKLVVAQTMLVGPLGDVVATPYDALDDALVIGYNVPGVSFNDPPQGHAVIAAAF